MFLKRVYLYIRMLYTIIFGIFLIFLYNLKPPYKILICGLLCFMILIDIFLMGLKYYKKKKEKFTDNNKVF